MPAETNVKLPSSYFTVATAGHVDHGKTSLIKALTGIDPDRLKEEKERQMTTDLGFAHLLLPGEKGSIGLGFIDVPGHGKFIKNMLAGVGGIEAALLVVAADEGPMPQTVQHVKILASLGVTTAVVALTKCDVVEKSRVLQVDASVRALLSRFGVEAAAVIGVSSVTRDGINDLKAALSEALGRVDNWAEGAAQESGYLPIDRVFAKPGYGTVVTGTLVEGTLKVGDQVTIEPGNFSARVRGLETFGKTQELARAGQRLAINLNLKDAKAVFARGHCVLAGHKNVTSDLLVEIIDYGSDNSAEAPVPGKSSLGARPVKLYHGTTEALGHLRWVEFLEGGRAYGHVHLDEPIVVSPEDRYVMRYSEDGIAGGTVLLCQKPRWLTRKLLHELAPMLVPLSGERDWPGAALLLLKHHPARAVHFDQLGWLLAQKRQAGCLSDLLKDNAAQNIGGFVIAREVKEAIRTKVLASLNTFLKSEDKALLGVNIETVRKMAAGSLDKHVFQEFVKGLGDDKLLVRKEDKIFGPDGGGAGPSLDPYTTRIFNLLESVVCLEMTELAIQTKSDIKQVKAAVDRLAKLKMAAVVDNDFAASRKSIDNAHQKLLKIWQEKKDISPADFRDEMASTRKYILALLAYFDAMQITRRNGAGRALLKQPPKIAQG
jgi:selenocysteine-specific elongation factor